MLEAEASERHIESMVGEGRTISLTGELLLEDTVIRAKPQCQGFEPNHWLDKLQKTEVTDHEGKPDLEGEYTI